jgi:Glyoxalase-like domain
MSPLYPLHYRGSVIRWAYVFVDRPRDAFDVAAAFWTAVTGTELSARRGERDEFATLIPPAGDASVKIQGVGGSGGAHLDLVVDDVHTLFGAAIGLGADVVAQHEDWYVMRSPGGQLFCITPDNGQTARPAVVPGPDGTTSRLDQIAIDVAADGYAAEAAFWPALTGWPGHTGSRTEFHVVQQPDHLPVRILIHRLDAPRPASAHLDIACSDIAAVRARHERLGATHVADRTHWTVMRDPAGGVYCLTGRDPETGRLG